MRLNTEWKDYEILAAGGGEKLERWGRVYLLRPDPQAIWEASYDYRQHPLLNAIYNRSTDGGGKWDIVKKFASEWTVQWRNLKYTVKPMGFKHTGLFPEQAANWDAIIKLIKEAKRKIKVLNLFAYTGGATVACLSAGAECCHVDSAKNMVERAKQNAEQNNLFNGRYIVDDCLKFVRREIKRGNKYDAVIMDPPSYGRGPNGEIWKIETDLFGLVSETAALLSDKPLFYLINSYTTGLQPTVLYNILKLTMPKNIGQIDAYEVCLPTKEEIILPCGASGLWHE